MNVLMNVDHSNNFLRTSRVPLISTGLEASWSHGHLHFRTPWFNGYWPKWQNLPRWMTGERLIKQFTPYVLYVKTFCVSRRHWVSFTFKRVWLAHKTYRILYNKQRNSPSYELKLEVGTTNTSLAEHCVQLSLSIFLPSTIYLHHSNEIETWTIQNCLPLFEDWIEQYFKQRRNCLWSLLITCFLECCNGAYRTMPLF